MSKQLLFWRRGVVAVSPSLDRPRPDVSSLRRGVCGGGGVLAGFSAAALVPAGRAVVGVERAAVYEPVRVRARGALQRFAPEWPRKCRERCALRGARQDSERPTLS